VAKTEKKAGGKPAVEPADKGSAARRTSLWFVAACIAAAMVSGLIYARSGEDRAATVGPKTDPAVSDLMMVGPLPEMAIGKEDAPTTIVEYASMTCNHCALFHENVFPEIKRKYIDTGQARFVFREFPLDGLAVAAFMLARCAGPDRYFPMVDGLFASQKTWAQPGADGKDKLLTIAKQAGFSQERFDQCLADKELFDNIVKVRERGHEKFGVDSTPTFFINGKRLRGGQDIKQFDAVIAGEEPPPDEPHDHDAH
jgi:protein-disulfide isomerase